MTDTAPNGGQDRVTDTAAGGTIYPLWPGNALIVAARRIRHEYDLADPDDQGFRPEALALAEAVAAALVEAGYVVTYGR